MAEIVHATVVDVEVHRSFDAVDAAEVCMLPESPRAFVVNLLDVVASNPERIAVELGSREEATFELQTGIDDRRHTIAVFYLFEPYKSFFAKLLRGEIAAFLDVKYGRHIACIEVHLMKVMLGLLHSRNGGREKMVSAAYKSIFAGVEEVVVEIFIEETLSLGGFDDDKRHGFFVDFGIGNLLPIDFALVMADVNTMDAVALRIDNVSVESAPTCGEGCKEIGEENED